MTREEAKRITHELNGLVGKHILEMAFKLKQGG